MRNLFDLEAYEDLSKLSSLIAMERIKLFEVTEEGKKQLLLQPRHFQPILLKLQTFAY